MIVEMETSNMDSKKTMPVSTTANVLNNVDHNNDFKLNTVNNENSMEMANAIANGNNRIIKTDLAGDQNGPSDTLMDTSRVNYYTNTIHSNSHHHHHHHHHLNHYQHYCPEKQSPEQKQIDENHDNDCDIATYSHDNNSGSGNHIKDGHHHHRHHSNHHNNGNNYIDTIELDADYEELAEEDNNSVSDSQSSMTLDNNILMNNNSDGTTNDNASIGSPSASIISQPSSTISNSASNNSLIISSPASNSSFSGSNSNNNNNNNFSGLNNSNSTNVHSIAEYLQQLLKDRVRLSSFPGAFFHADRLIENGK